MINYIEEIEISENERSFTVTNIKVTGNSLLEKAKNKNSALNFIKNIKELKVRGKSNQFIEYIKLTLDFLFSIPTFNLLIFK